MVGCFYSDGECKNESGLHYSPATATQLRCFIAVLRLDIFRVFYYRTNGKYAIVMLRKRNESDLENNSQKARCTNSSLEVKLCFPVKKSLLSAHASISEKNPAGFWR